MNINIEHVKEEIENIRKFATGEQKSRLCFQFLDVHSEHFCIYGQMTGNCKNESARMLINNCCKNFFVTNRALDDLVGCIELSPLEKFIMDKPKSNKNIIAYIKNETNELNIND